MPENNWSRRKFLSTLSASTGLLALGSLINTGCSGRSDKNFRFVFMTDIHIERRRRAVEGFKQAIEHVNNLKPKPDFVITGGDLVMDILNKDFEKADMLIELYKETVKELEMMFPGKVAVDRLKQKDQIIEFTPDTVIKLDDILAIVGSRSQFIKADELLGPEVDDTSVADLIGEIIDICVLSKDAAGKTLGQISKDQGHG